MMKLISPKTVSLIFLIVVQIGCQNLQKRNQKSDLQAPVSSAETLESTKESTQDLTEATSSTEQERKPDVPKKVKIGVLFGPGGLRLYSQVGVLQELIKQKVPIDAVAGIETGAIVAALYAHKNQPFDVEWQLMKLSESDWLDKGFLKNQPQNLSVQKLNATLYQLFGETKTSESRTPFSCPSYNVQKARTFMMSRGEFRQLLPYCIGLDPLFPEWQSTIAQVVDYQPLLGWFKSQGVQKVIFVNVLPKNSVNSQFQVSQLVLMATEKNLREFDFVISISPEGNTFVDFEQRRSNLEIGRSQSESQIKKIVEVLGL